MNISLFNAARNVYAGNNLEYHNWQHILSVSNARRFLYDTAPTPELEMAILWHDSVYVPGAPPGYNETLSCYKLENMIIKLDIQPDFDLQKVKDIIMGTVTDNYTSNSYSPTCREVAEMVDCDISALGDPDYSKFETLQDYVIEEFVGTLKQYKEEKITSFRKKRAKFLAGIGGKNVIYHTEEARSKLEENALNNIWKYHKKYG